MIDISSVFSKPILLASFGRVSEITDFNSDKVFINISEIPCHAEIQNNIANILDFLNENFFITQAFQVYSVGYFQSKRLSTKKTNELELMLNSGQITGAEYFSILNHKKGNFLLGIDDENLLLKAIDLNGQMTQYYADADRLISNYKRKLEELKDKYFTQENQIFNKELNSKEKNGNDWFYKRLKQYIDGLNVSWQDYQNLSYHIENIISSESLNYDLINKEIQEIVERLKQEISYGNYRKLLDATQNFNKTGIFYIYLSRISEISPELLEGLPNARNFLNYNNRNQKLNPIELISEEEDCVHKIFRNNVQTHAEREVVFLIEFIDALRSFLHMSNRENYEFFTANINNSFKKLWAKYTGDNIIPDVEKYIKAADEYYRNNLHRGECFVKNSKVFPVDSRTVPELPHHDTIYLDTAVNALEKAKEIYVFITGGFHSKYLAEEFKQSGYSYIGIIPNVVGSANLTESYQILREKVQLQHSMHKKLA